MLRSRRYMIWIGFLTACYLSYVVGFKYASISLMRLALGTLVILLGLLPTLVYLKQGMREGVPLMPLHGLFYAFSFGMVAFAEVNLLVRPSEHYMVWTLGLASAGILSLYAGYYFAGNALFKKIRPFTFQGSFRIEDLAIFGWICEGAYLIWVLFLPTVKIPSVEQLVPVVGWVGKGILFFQFLSGRMGMTTKILLWSLVLPCEILYGFSTGLSSMVMIVLVFFAVVYLAVKRKVPILVLVFCVLVFYIFQPVKAEYRRLIWAGHASERSVFEKTMLLFELAHEYYFEPGVFLDASEAFYSRTDHLGTTAAIVSQTPEIVPYLYGRTYSNLLTSWIPRIIWPGKPQENLGNEWAKWYRLLDPSDFDTSYNLPWLPEFYMNFGVPGVLVGMFMVGLFFRFLTVKFCSRTDSPGEFLIGLVLTFKLFAAESNLSLMMGSLIPIFVALYLTMRLAALFQKKRGFIKI